MQLKCETGHCLLKSTDADDFPEVVEIHKLSGSFCTTLKVRTASLANLEGLIERIGANRNLNSHVVLSTQYERHTVGPPAPSVPTVTPAERWT